MTTPRIKPEDRPTFVALDKHAREWAQNVFASIEIDLREDASTFREAVASVRPKDEWRSARVEMSRSLRLYEGRWQRIFEEAFAEAVKQYRLRCLDKTVSEHLGRAQDTPDVFGRVYSFVGSGHDGSGNRQSPRNRGK